MESTPVDRPVMPPLDGTTSFNDSEMLASMPIQIDPGNMDMASLEAVTRMFASQLLQAQQAQSAEQVIQSNPLYDPNTGMLRVPGYVDPETLSLNGSVSSEHRSRSRAGSVFDGPRRTSVAGSVHGSVHGGSARPASVFGGSRRPSIAGSVYQASQSRPPTRPPSNTGSIQETTEPSFDTRNNASSIHSAKQPER